MTKNEKREAILLWIAAKLTQMGYCEQSVQWDINMLRMGDYGSGLSDAACNVITSDEFLNLNGAYLLKEI